MNLADLGRGMLRPYGVTPMPRGGDGSHGFCLDFFLGLRCWPRDLPALFSAVAPFFSGGSSPNAGATLSASCIPPQSQHSASPLCPGTSSAPAATPISFASSSSNTTSSATLPPNSSTSNPSGFTSPFCWRHSCPGQQDYFWSWRMPLPVPCRVFTFCPLPCFP